MIFFFFFYIVLWWGTKALMCAEHWSTLPASLFTAMLESLAVQGEQGKWVKGALIFLSGTSRCQALVPLVPQSGGCPWRGSWAECALCWGLVLEDKWVLSGHPRPSPLAAPLLYHCHSCHSSPCHTWSRRWGIASMENRIATVEWPSRRGSWGASHTSDRFELYSMISLIYQMHIYINF